MSKKHYEAVAKVLCESYLDMQTRMESETCLETLDALTGELVTIFKNDNRRFDKERFLNAVNRCQRNRS